MPEQFESFKKPGREHVIVDCTLPLSAALASVRRACQGIKAGWWANHQTLGCVYPNMGQVPQVIGCASYDSVMWNPQQPSSQ